MKNCEQLPALADRQGSVPVELGEADVASSREQAML
jgi:hypothetical protein